MSMGKRVRRGPAEQDVFSTYWRRTYAYTKRCASKVKRIARRRERRESKYVAEDFCLNYFSK